MTDRPAVPEPTAPALTDKIKPALRMRHVLAAVVVGLLALGLALLADWWLLQPADHDAWADVVRSTVLALGLLGAVPAGYVAYRKQQTTEAEHQLDQRRHELDQGKEQRRQVELDDANERATAKDFRDRYTAAATQLGSDKAPIRLAGVYALAQLADEWGRTEPDQRQTCIDVLCAYLRMPWPLKAPEDASEQEKLDRTRVRDEETRVRETILRVIATRLRGDNNPHGWHANHFDLTGAELPNIEMMNIRVTGMFNAAEATFSGKTTFFDAAMTEPMFNQATFCGPVEFHSVKINGPGWFEQAVFHGPARFTNTEFSAGAAFAQATFHAPADFRRAKFNMSAKLTEVKFSGPVSFANAVFSGAVDFTRATFTDATFTDATFTDATFLGVTFAREALCEGAAIMGNLVRMDGTAEDWSREPRPFVLGARPAPAPAADP